MSETKWTPGPWTYWVWADHCENAGLPASFGVESYDGGGSIDIGRFDDVDHVELAPDEQHANARLIAAAPELYEVTDQYRQAELSARRQLDAYWSHVHNAVPDDKPDGLRAVTDCMEIVRGAFVTMEEWAKAALAKARGEEPR